MIDKTTWVIENYKFSENSFSFNPNEDAEMLETILKTVEERGWM